jgi:hypothetical protein
MERLERSYHRRQGIRLCVTAYLEPVKQLPEAVDFEAFLCLDIWWWPNCL